ncbi:CTLH/CRA C-terminal to lish motif domain-containing protein [Diplogelasinospora grovesii]|uniref:CTLH/CRA C-terminal to lish motif domain-containing protein n=1 Tax=Diplogelasinospora grovesii TaxID=303347 RepID=A0AAN6N731_9PEZI|nr:CTLH/CRA C-terminal to lish motif domain-containing protein [Diplogelasinospora grovesii]
MADLEASKINHENHLLLDQPLLRLPYELLRKNFRSAHFTFEKESTFVKNLLKETATGSLNGRTSPEDVVKNLDIMLTRMRGMKRKLSTYADDENKLYRQLDARVSHLSELSDMHSVEDVKYETWSRKRLDRLLVDYMLRHGHTQSAVSLSTERDMRDLVDIDIFVQMDKIKQSLLDHKVSDALSWCTENKKELRRNGSNLEFMLRCQQYIEMMRTGDQTRMIEAIGHARKYLAPYNDTYPVEVGQMAGLLAYRETTELEPYRSWYHPGRWTDLANIFVEEHNKLLGLPSFPLLHTALSSGLSALKTPACHASHSAQSRNNRLTRATRATRAALSSGGGGGGGGNGGNATVNDPTTTGSSHHSTSSLTTSVCPICSTELNKLARNVPYAHHSKSHVEHDLMLLPNGRVYGKERLEEYAKKSGLPPAGQVKDLVTGDVYTVDKLKKVFIT